MRGLNWKSQVAIRKFFGSNWLTCGACRRIAEPRKAFKEGVDTSLNVREEQTGTGRNDGFDAFSSWRECRKGRPNASPPKSENLGSGSRLSLRFTAHPAPSGAIE